VEDALVFLSDAISHIKVTEGFRNVLEDRQLDEVDCAAINLSATVTEYLAMAIEYFTDKTLGKNLLSQFLNFVFSGTHPKRFTRQKEIYHCQRGYSQKDFGL
jgi:hypothetical protein